MQRKKTRKGSSTPPPPADERVTAFVPAGVEESKESGPGGGPSAVAEPHVTRKNHSELLFGNSTIIEGVAMPLSEKEVPGDAGADGDIPHILCASCGLYFDKSPENPTGVPSNRVYFRPVARKEGGGYILAMGMYCMPGCVMAKYYDPYVPSQTPEGVELFYEMMKGLGWDPDTPLPVADPREMLQPYGGPVSVAEFRMRGGYGGVPPTHPSRGLVREASLRFVESRAIRIITQGDNSASSFKDFLAWIGRMSAAAAEEAEARAAAAPQGRAGPLREGMAGIDTDVPGDCALLRVLREKGMVNEEGEAVSPQPPPTPPAAEETDAAAEKQEKRRPGRPAGAATRVKFSDIKKMHREKHNQGKAATLMAFLQRPERKTQKKPL